MLINHILEIFVEMRQCFIQGHWNDFSGSLCLFSFFKIVAADFALE